LDTTNGKCHISEPFEWADRESPNVIEGDRERMNLFVLNYEIDVDHRCIDHFVNYECDIVWGSGSSLKLGSADTCLLQDLSPMLQG
jgi:hypothetical protein